MNPIIIKRAIIVTISIIAIAAIFFIVDRSFATKIYPNITIGEVEVGGLSREEALEKIKLALSKLDGQGIEYQYQNFSYFVSPVIISPFDPDASYRIIDPKYESAVETAFLKGKNGSILRRILSIVSITTAGRKIPLEVTINREEFKNILTSQFSRFENLSKNASFIIDNQDQIQILPEKSGQEFAYEEAIAQTQRMIEGVRLAPLSLSLNEKNAQRQTSWIESQKGTISQLISAAKNGFTLQYENEEWLLPSSKIKSWIGILSPKAGEFAIGIDAAKTMAELDKIAKTVDVTPQNAKFVMQDNKVNLFTMSLAGKKINKEQTAMAIEKALKEEQNKTTLIVETVEPEIGTENSNLMGIKETIGIGRSNFKGSPKNRRHNIAVGAAALHGTIIQPNEEFSLLKTLGDINGTTGYREELVIKGNKTVPEFGGGLCQIGTTTFRAALASGLPITERRNHSYRVSYYEPAGTDATIYENSPDFKFTNDTGSHILIQTFIKGDEIAFEFWGSRDGRNVTQTHPIVYNIKPAPPAKLIETADLKPGEKKCTERPHAGADAKFTYTVDYPNGEKKQTVFRSHYIPWQEVCLVGIDPNKPVVDPTTPPTPAPSLSPEEIEAKRIDELRVGFIQ
ncbi:MAG: hypothetical protein G01um101418_448 [Parcubacteria group bacterium Gr01-1014_18]|nr:MAG: hypothetical protein Greene041636_493 [Parcubacteria group bacterium Greene0416_36]TSC81035.1 MAG: hypothetical protein G01um101418_448 [Parcubacteria group bacterium Gr01-1014_18]TSC98957.1 MAG: hypothetical protein Greene101420_469 [Parcubacteria group bacterium Greene1014_20]TSD06751.1 MAG: hypothetical protein Greene07142_672 [Parcubacteria group bacterium Greene0714_2]